MDTPMLKYKKKFIYVDYKKKSNFWFGRKSICCTLNSVLFFIFIEIVISVGTVPNC